MWAKQSICYRQAETYGVLLLGLRPITILLIQSTNLFTLAPLLRSITLDNDETNTLQGAYSTHASLCLLNTDAAALRVFERKVLRKILGPVRVGDYFRIQYNSELYELLNDLDVVQRINIQRLCWLGFVVRIGEEDDLVSVGRT